MFTVRLLGQFNIQYEDTPILIASRPGQSLLARLVLTAGIAHRREKLAGDQWPDASEANALSNLRHALWRIRGGLKRAGADPDNYITADDLVIRFNADAAYWVDALVVEQESKRATATVKDLMQAQTLYRGELLPGFYDDSDDWATPFRSQLTMAFDRLMARLVERLRDDACWPQIMEMGRYWVAHGESQELAYRELMIAHGALGDLSGVRADYRDCAAYLRKELGADASPETRALFEQLLRGAYQLAPSQTPSRNGTAPTPAAPAATQPPPNNLPTHPTPFVGRTGDLNDIAWLLAQPDCRLLTLIGPGGVGKTRLAIKTASAALKDMAEAFSDGVYFARLDAATTSEALLTALSDAVRHVPFGQEYPKTQLLNFLREKKMLLVLDNFEQLLSDDVDGASLVDEMLATAQGVKALVTSRERLHLPSEHLVEVDGLDFPNDADIAAEDDDSGLMRFGAVQLFLQAAQRILSRFSFEAEKDSVARICTLTQGMPLALELAAAWVRALSCKEIAARIEMNLDVLATTIPDMPQRHRSVRAVLDYSWQLLSPQERNAFAALSVFRAGFELDAADDVARTRVTMLYALVDKSLLRRSPAGRYEMHDLVRRYGEEKLDASEDEDYSPDTVHARMARYFLQFATAHGKDYPALEPEWANFLAAMRAAHERYEWHMVTQMAQALTDAWFTRARFSDAREGLKLSSEAAAADDDLPALANVLRWRGKAAARQGAYDEAKQYLGLAHTMFGELQSNNGLAQVEVAQAFVESELSNYTLARQLVDAALPKLDDEQGLIDRAEGVLLKARLHYQYIEDSEARDLAREAFMLESKVGRVSPTTLAWLALLEEAVGDLDAALQCCHDALKRCDESQTRWEEALALYTRSQIYRRMKSFVGAIEDAQRALSLFRHYGDRKMQAHAQTLLGYINFDAGNTRDAFVMAQISLKLLHELNDQWELVKVTAFIGELHDALGNRELACESWSQALVFARATNHPKLGEIERRLGPTQG